MSKHAAVLQNYNQELVKNIEYLKTQKEKINQAIQEDQQEKKKILEQIEQLNERLETINTNLDQKIKLRDDCENTLSEAEKGFTKIIESSEVLLSLVQRESEVLRF